MSPAMPGVEVRPEPLDSPVARRLIAELNAELSLDYPPAQRFHSLDAEEVAEGVGAFVVLWLDGEPAGCGAVRLLPRDGIPGDGIPPEAIPGEAIPGEAIPDEAVAELKRRGADFMMEPRAIRPGVRIAFVRAPDNVRIELLERT